MTPSRTGTVSKVWRFLLTAARWPLELPVVQAESFGWWISRQAFRQGNFRGIEWLLVTWRSREMAEHCSLPVMMARFAFGTLCRAQGRKPPILSRRALL